MRQLHQIKPAWVSTISTSLTLSRISFYFFLSSLNISFIVISAAITLSILELYVLLSTIYNLGV